MARSCMYKKISSLELRTIQFQFAISTVSFTSLLNHGILHAAFMS